MKIKRYRRQHNVGAATGHVGGDDAAAAYATAMMVASCSVVLALSTLWDAPLVNCRDQML